MGRRKQRNTRFCTKRAETAKRGVVSRNRPFCLWVLCFSFLCGCVWVHMHEEFRRVKVRLKHTVTKHWKYIKWWDKTKKQSRTWQYTWGGLLWCLSRSLWEWTESDVMATWKQRGHSCHLSCQRCRDPKRFQTVTERIRSFTFWKRTASWNLYYPRKECRMSCVCVCVY